MSTCPGETLERFLMWNYDLIVDGDRSANLSLHIAEAVGVDTRRRRITGEQFAKVVEVFEPYRDQIERRLGHYNEEECGSWRDYSWVVSDGIPERIFEEGGVRLPPR